jgi:N-acetylneuraminic acid mutarotase
MTPTLALLGALVQTAPAWGETPPLPTPIANNAVAAVRTLDGPAVFTFLGIDSTKAWDGRLSIALRWDVGSAEWRPVRAVPGEGLLAATAQTVRGRVYLFGGYTVAEDGSEHSLPNVDIYDPETDQWSSGAPMPVPVDDAVSGVWRDSLIYLVSGWHDRDNVDDVQIYDPAADRWMTATPIPGAPVFGHTGGIAGNTIVYIDGTRTLPEGRPRFRIEGSAWAGDIDPDHPEVIRWRRLPPHPGPALYRGAAAGVSNRWVFFVGGSDNPYNYDGQGYDGVPSEPRAGAFAWDAQHGRWFTLPALSVATMDHRGIAILGPELFLVGGMESGQRVTRRVVRAHLADLLSTRPEP